MGKLRRWLKTLFGKKKKKSGSGEDPTNPNPTKLRGSFRARDDGADASREDQTKHAIAVAAATAAAAEAAVAAAQAAAVVVRLTSGGWGGDGRRGVELAAVRIQAVFRGYLARRALKALKGLVKLQALVRGHIVRKQAVETLRCMQAMVRVQSKARAGRAIVSNHPRSTSSRHHYPGPPTPDKDAPKMRIDGAKPVRSSSAKRNGFKPKNTGLVDPSLLNSSGWNWLDHWMEERYWDSRDTLSRTGTTIDDEKILEVDAGKPHVLPRWRNCQQSISSSLTSDQNSRIFMATPDSPSKDSTEAQYSIPSPPSVGMQQSLSPLRLFHEAEDVCESPRFYPATSRTASSRRGPFTPSKSECSHSFMSSYGDHPNYMSYTESSRAKLRSHSAPRQRPDFEKSISMKKLGACDLSSASQRSSSLHQKFTGKTYPGSGRLDKMGMPIPHL